MAKLAPWFAGLLIMAALVALVTHAGELKTLVTILQNSQPWLLVLAVLLQLSTYVSVAFCWRAVLADTGASPPFRKLLSLSVAKLFADQAVPSAGISGNLLLLNRLIALGVNRSRAVTAMTMAIIGYYCAYAFMAAIVLLLLWIHKNATAFLASAVSVFLAVALGIVILLLLLLGRGARMPEKLLRFSLLKKLTDVFADVPSNIVKKRTLLLEVTVLNGAVFVADALTLWVILAAIGLPSAFATAFIAFLLASMAVTLGPIPMGLGSFEGVCIGMLRALGVPIEAAATATLVFRGFALWFPLIPGLALGRRMLRRSYGGMRKSGHGSTS